MTSELEMGPNQTLESIKSDKEFHISDMKVEKNMQGENAEMFGLYNKLDVNGDRKPNIEDLFNQSEFKKFVCKFCKYKATLAHTMKVHIEMNHIKLRFVCKLCLYNSCERYTLKNHLRDKHSIQTKDSDEKTELECGICLERNDVIEFKSHLEEHHPNYFEAYDPVSSNKRISVKLGFCVLDLKESHT